MGLALLVVSPALADAPISVIPREEVLRSGFQLPPEAERLANAIGRRVQAGLRWTW